MSKDAPQDLPEAVVNLRKIWKRKQAEIQITQTEAAKTLGWTQGAFSQFLNAITELNAAHIIKLANFLDVDPCEIDPNIRTQLPAIQSKELRWSLSSANKTRHQKLHTASSLPGAFFIKVDKENNLAPVGALLTVVPITKDIPPRITDTKPWCVVQKTEDSEFELMHCADAPDRDQCFRKFNVVSISLW